MAPDAPENPNTPEKANDAPTTAPKENETPKKNLTDAEKQELLRNYEATRDRIAKARQKLTDIRGMLSNKEDDGKTVPPEIKKLYSEAEALLDGIIKEFPKLKGMNETERGDAITHRMMEIEEQERNRYEEILKKNDINTGEVLSRLFTLEKDAKIIIEAVNQLRAYGLTEKQIQEYFLNEFTPKRLTDIVPFFKKTKDIGMDTIDACEIWQKSLKEEMEEDQTEIREYYIAVYAATQLSVSKINSLHRLREDKEKIIAFFEKMKDESLSPEECIGIFYMERNPEKAKKLLQDAQTYTDKGFSKVQACAMARSVEGYHGSILGFDTTQRDITGFIKALQEKGCKPNQIAILWKLFPDKKTIAMRDDNMHATIVRGNPASALAFIDELQKKGISSDNIIDWYEETQLASEALRGIALIKEYPDIGEKSQYTIGRTGGYKRESKVINFANFFNLQTSPEMKDFMKFIILHSDGVEIENLESFKKDETLPLALDVYKRLGNGDVALALKIGRNLYYQGYREVPDTGVLEAKIKELTELQQDADATKIFDGRNVLYVANGEKKPDGTLRFNSPEIKDNIKKSVGENGTVTYEAPSSDKPTVEELQEIKKRVLERLADTPPPMTFFFNGHGGPGQLYINSGQVVGDRVAGENMDFINMDEIADALKKRTEKYDAKTLAKDIVIFGACYNHNSIRMLYEACKKNNAVAPIAMGNSEYGMYGFQGGNDAKDVEYAVLQIGKRGTTIGDVRRNEKEYAPSDYSVYVPNTAGQPQQVAENKTVSDRTKRRSA